MFSTKFKNICCNWKDKIFEKYKMPNILWNDCYLNLNLFMKINELTQRYLQAETRSLMCNHLENHFDPHPQGWFVIKNC